MCEFNTITVETDTIGSCSLGGVPHKYKVIPSGRVAEDCTCANRCSTIGRDKFDSVCRTKTYLII